MKEFLAKLNKKEKYMIGNQFFSFHRCCGSRLYSVAVAGSDRSYRRSSRNEDGYELSSDSGSAAGHRRVHKLQIFHEKTRVSISTKKRKNQG